MAGQGDAAVAGAEGASVVEAGGGVRRRGGRSEAGGNHERRGEGMEEEGPGLKYPKPLAPGDNFNRYLRAP